MYTVKRVQSGFYSVWNGESWINAALTNEAAAREFIQKLEKWREERQKRRSPTK